MKKEPLVESAVRKGGVNARPQSPRPGPPAPQRKVIRLKELGLKGEVYDRIDVILNNEEYIGSLSTIKLGPLPSQMMDAFKDQVEPPQPGMSDADILREDNAQRMKRADDLLRKKNTRGKLVCLQTPYNLSDSTHKNGQANSTPEKSEDKMPVQYDLEKCKKWFDHLKQACPTASAFVAAWYGIAFGEMDAEWLLVEWKAMSLWERQAILYMFVPEIERVAKEQACKLSQEARAKEPL
jgi:hypothetical protein